MRADVHKDGLALSYEACDTVGISIDIVSRPVLGTGYNAEAQGSC